jgi:hypothetical protein
MNKMKVSDYSHVSVCIQSLKDDEVFGRFKKIPAFTFILEHTSEYYAHKYLDLLFKRYKSYLKSFNWEKLKENDILGSPNIIKFDELIKYCDGYYSPSTIYYIYRGIEIIDTILKEQKKINILEIGGGYGGQCKIIIDLCKFLKIKIENYGIIDLECVSKLQNKYLNYFKYKNVQYYEYENIKDFGVFERYDTLISMYALGEFEIDMQNYYIDNIISKYIKKYFIIWNTQNINEYFINDIITDEEPKTNIDNKLIIKI